MSTESPTFFLSSRENTGRWAEVRACRLLRRLRGPYHDQYALVKVEPPIAGGKSREPVMARLILAPHSGGTSLFPVSEFPLPVYVYQILNERVVEGEMFEAPDVELVAWCEIYRTAEEAATTAASS